MANNFFKVHHEVTLADLCFDPMFRNGGGSQHKSTNATTCNSGWMATKALKVLLSCLLVLLSCLPVLLSCLVALLSRACACLCLLSACLCLRLPAACWASPGLFWWASALFAPNPPVDPYVSPLNRGYESSPSRNEGWTRLGEHLSVC